MMASAKSKVRSKLRAKGARLERTKQNARTKSRAKSAQFGRTKQSRRRSKTREFDPTPQSYGPLHRACTTLNKTLFGATLPPSLVTLQRKSRALGYFWGRKFRSADGAIITDEIALNPAHFAQRGAKKVLSTLAHELCHQWQQHFGKPSQRGYHNAEWAAKMAEIGLVASDTGRPGGKKTGPRISHYIKPGGAFDRAADKLIAKGFALAFVERTTMAERKIALKKRQSKTRYSCERCDLNAWAKPGAKLVCGTCHQPLVPQSI
jgi:hypothetical protein